MSAGTMIACACKEIFMGKQSSLGPVDPQFRGIPAHGVVEEFERAVKDIRADQATIPIWQPILAKYTPAFIGECEKAIAWANEMVNEWLVTGMFSEMKSARKKAKIDNIVKELTDHALSKSHERHLSYSRCEKMGLVVKRLEEDQRLQDAVLSVHHACIITLSSTGAYKIIENHFGRAFIQIAHQLVDKA
jgi:membrane-bound ClpP family serine protease